MYKYGDKRDKRVELAITLAMLQSKVEYSRIGFWDDICYYQGDETLEKLERLKEDMPTKVYENLRKIIEEDNKQNSHVLLGGYQEVADILGVTRAAVYDRWKWMQSPRSRSDFPRPYTITSSGPMWNLNEVEEYAQRKGLGKYKDNH